MNIFTVINKQRKKKQIFFSPVHKIKIKSIRLIDWLIDWSITSSLALPTIWHTLHVRTLNSKIANRWWNRKKINLKSEAWNNKQKKLFRSNHITHVTHFTQDKHWKNTVSSVYSVSLFGWLKLDYFCDRSNRW